MTVLEVIRNIGQTHLLNMKIIVGLRVTDILVQDPHQQLADTKGATGSDITVLWFYTRYLSSSRASSHSADCQLPLLTSALLVEQKQYWPIWEAEKVDIYALCGFFVRQSELYMLSRKNIMKPRSGRGWH